MTCSESNFKSYSLHFLKFDAINMHRRPNHAEKVHIEWQKELNLMTSQKSFGGIKQKSSSKWR